MLIGKANKQANVISLFNLFRCPLCLVYHPSLSLLLCLVYHPCGDIRASQSIHLGVPDSPQTDKQTDRHKTERRMSVCLSVSVSIEAVALFISSPVCLSVCLIVVRQSLSLSLASASTIIRHTE